jgi:Uncharacterized lipoprotein
VKRLSLRRVLLCELAIALSLVAGCAGKGDVRYVDLQLKKPAAQSAALEPVVIVIEPFEDRRAEKTRVGIRTHLWGGVTNYTVAGERPSEMIAQALADQLQARGWQGQAWNVRVASAGSAPDADIVISGQVHDFSARAKSRVFSTVIETSSKFTIQARNLGDKSTTMRSVEGAQSRTVFWFEDGDVQHLLSATLKDGIDRLIADTKIEQKSLRQVR